MDVPDILPFGKFIRHIEMARDSWDIDAGGQCRIAKQVAAAVRVDLARILEVHGERRFARKEKSADI